MHHVPLRLPPELMARTDTIVVSDEEIAQARTVVEWIGARRIGSRLLASRPAGYREAKTPAGRGCGSVELAENRLHRAALLRIESTAHHPAEQVESSVHAVSVARAPRRRRGNGVVGKVKKRENRPRVRVLREHSCVAPLTEHSLPPSCTPEELT